MVSVFTRAELAYLTGREERRLARIATVGRDGMPHVTPTGWSYDGAADAIDVGGIDLEATKKYRDAARTGVAALVVDDVLPPWRPRGIEVRGRVELVAGPRATIRIHPRRIVSWGIEDEEMGRRHARDVAGGPRR